MDIWGAGDRNGVGVETETGVSFLAELEGGSLSGMWEFTLLRLTNPFLN